MNFGLSCDIHRWTEVKVHQQDCDYLGISMEDSPRSFLGDMDMQETLKRRKQKLVELEVHFNTRKVNNNNKIEGQQALQCEVATTHDMIYYKEFDCGL